MRIAKIDVSTKTATKDVFANSLIMLNGISCKRNPE